MKARQLWTLMDTRALAITTENRRSVVAECRRVERYVGTERKGQDSAVARPDRSLSRKIGHSLRTAPADHDRRLLNTFDEILILWRARRDSNSRPPGSKAEVKRLAVTLH